jgi:RNA polymerase sigma-70 factor (ECF subfamily)
MATVGLVESFLARLSPGAPVDPPRRARLSRDLETAWQAARRSWPGIDLASEEFAAFLAARLPGVEPVEDELPRLHAVDLYLACACENGNDAAQKALEGMCREAAADALRGQDPSGALSAEVAQGLLSRLLFGGASGAGKIGQYQGRSAMKAFLRVAAVREALNLRRARRRERPLAEDLLLRLVSEEDPELALWKERYRKEFKQAFQQVLGSLSPRDRNLLSHQVIENLSLDQIGAMYHVNRSTVCRWLQAIRDRLRQDTRAVLAERFSVDVQDVDSILRLVLSRIDASLERVLAGPGPKGT